MATVPNSTKAAQLVQAALGYANQGFYVFPVHTMAQGRCTCDDPACNSPAKHPLTPNGLLDATNDATVIRNWWIQAPQANVAIRTGPESRLWVLDLDGTAGLKDLETLEIQHGPLPAAPTARTGGGGRHVYFAWPEDRNVQNRAKCHGMSIDVRGNGGYGVAPPSDHESDDRYAWELDIGEIDPPPAPAWLLKWVTNEGSHGQALGSGKVLIVQDDDLESAPGAPKGQRHDQLCRLVGHHLQRGDNIAAVEPLALAWAERCTPPLPGNETQRTVRSLASSHEKGLNSLNSQVSDDEVENLELPPERAWPTLHPNALQGLAGDIIRRIEPQTEADPTALLLQTLAYYGSIVGRHAHCLVEEDTHFPNIFVCLIGDTSHGRKGASAGRIRRVFKKVDGEGWIDQRVQTGLSSGEGLIWAVRDAVSKNEPIKERGRVVGYEDVVVDQGVADKRLLVVEPEFAKVLRQTRREGNILSPVVRQAWDTGVLRILTKNSPVTATGVHISIVGHCTPSELRKYLTETEVANGFANRFLWCLTRRSKCLPEGGSPVAVGDFVARLKESVQFAKDADLITRDDEATHLWREEYPNLSEGRIGMFGEVTSRAEAQVLRLSLIYALLDRSVLVKATHLQAALAVWRYCEDSARYIFGESTSDPVADHVLRLVKSQPGISRTELHKSFSGHLDAKLLVAAIGSLRNLGLIRRELRPTSGRPKECWFPFQRPCEKSERCEEIRGEEGNVCSHLSLNPQVTSKTDGAGAAGEDIDEKAHGREVFEI